jgi:uncharacterized membrane protein
MYVLQHAGIHAALAWTFGSTLRRGSTPLVTAMAERVHERVTPAMAAYTRQVTQLWAAYFVAMIAASFALFSAAPWAWWSLFCNLVTPLAALALFCAELLWRHWRHPDFERVSMARVMHAWRSRSARRSLPEGGAR